MNVCTQFIWVSSTIQPARVCKFFGLLLPDCTTGPRFYSITRGHYGCKQNTVSVEGDDDAAEDEEEEEEEEEEAEEDDDVANHSVYFPSPLFVFV